MELVTLTLTVTTCKRLQSFKRTMEAFFKHCKDFRCIHTVLVVDDSSSDEDRNEMKRLYPFITLISHEKKSHAHSLNLIRKHVNTDLIFMFEDDWECQEDFEIGSILQYMATMKIDNIRTNTILMNGQLDETTFFNIFSPSQMIPEYKEWCAIQGYRFKENERGCCYPGFSLNPIILYKEVLDAPFNETIPSGFMEFDWAARHADKMWYGKNIGGIKHIENNPSAYVLNETHRWWDERILDYDLIQMEEQPFADRLGPCLVRIFKPKKFLDVGCGPGMHVRVMSALGVDSMGIEIDERAKHVLIRNESLLDMHGKYTSDLVMSLEVAEHIDARYADDIVQNVYESIEPGGTLVWTAAHPGQGGVGHINCQPKEYWISKFLTHGLVRDEHLEQKIKDEMLQGYHMGWFIMNLLVFRRPKN